MPPATSNQEAHDVTTKRTRATQDEEPIATRLGRLRRERGITQSEMAERLGISQPIVSDYERGELRLHGELIVKLATILGVSADELLGIEATRAERPATNRRLYRRIQQIDGLPKRDQEALLRTIDAFLAKGRTAAAPT